jgi:hypothetical protein
MTLIHSFKKFERGKKDELLLSWSKWHLYFKSWKKLREKEGAQGYLGATENRKAHGS